MKKLLAATCALAMMGTAASATTVTFETDESADPNFIAVAPGGVMGVAVDDVGLLDIIGRRFSGESGSIALGPQEDINQNVEGLGVRNSRLDNSDVDGFVRNDIIVFTFDRNVRLSNVIFENVSNNDDFVFYVPGNMPNAVDFDIVNPIPNDTDGDEGIFDFGNQVVSTFGIGARGRNDDFRISRVEVNAVPLPASALLLLAGVGGLAAMRRKKS